MQELKLALEEVKDLHQKVFGRPAPELGPQSLIPFPTGVDPYEHALAEVKHLKEVSEKAAFAPRTGAWTPLADCFLVEDEFIVRLEVPGVSREDLNVFVIGGECVVRGERKQPQLVGAIKPMAMERPWGFFERRFVVPVGARLDELKARAFDGLLELRVPMERIEALKEKKVDVV